MLNFILTALADNYIQVITLAGGFMFTRFDRIMPAYVRHALTIILLLITLSTVFEYADVCFQSVDYYSPYAREFSTFMGYIIKPGIFMAVNLFFFSNLRAKIATIVLEIVNIAVCSSIFFSPIVCSFPNNAFTRGPLGYFPHIMGGVLFAVFILASLQTYKDSPSTTRRILTFIVVVIFFSLLVDTISTRHVLNTTLCICTMLYYFYIYMQKLNQVRKEQDEKLRLQRDELMTSQIQPHFIYNTLNTIYYLCYDNAEKAADTVVKFSEYLRNNLELGITSDKLISITRELENTRIYSDIEMLRFDELSVEYDIEDDEFDVPALCVQPIVENAIRHGVKGMEGGRVLIRTYETKDSHVIVIKDNGIGYVRSTPNLGKRSHIGVQNVKDRIVRMCGGTFDIDMVKGKGTTVTLTIPKKESEELRNENISG